MTRRRSPRPLGSAIRPARERSRPKTLLAAVQGVWAEVAGPAVTVEAQPVAERDGLVTVACRSATWAQELDLLQSELLGRLNKALSESAAGEPPPAVTALRFTADAPRHTD